MSLAHRSLDTLKFSQGRQLPPCLCVVDASTRAFEVLRPLADGPTASIRILLQCFQHSCVDRRPWTLHARTTGSRPIIMVIFRKSAHGCIAVGSSFGRPHVCNVCNPPVEHLSLSSEEEYHHAHCQQQNTGHYPGHGKPFCEILYADLFFGRSTKKPALSGYSVGPAENSNSFVDVAQRCCYRRQHYPPVRGLRGLARCVATLAGYMPAAGRTVIPSGGALQCLDQYGGR